MENLALSIVIPSLNEEKYLPQLIQSLINQKGLELQVIVVDGSSWDNTVSKVKETFNNNSNPNIYLEVYTVNKRNVSFQRNFGAKKAKCLYLAFMDADTLIKEEDTLYNILERFIKMNLVVCSCRFRPIEGGLLANFIYSFLYIFQKAIAKFNPFVAGIFILTKKDIFEKVGGFDEEILVNEDAELCNRIKSLGKLAILNYFIYTSNRRFQKQGYIYSIYQYIKIFVYTILKKKIKKNYFHYFEKDILEKRKNIFLGRLFFAIGTFFLLINLINFQGIFSYINTIFYLLLLINTYFSIVFCKNNYPVYDNIEKLLDSLLLVIYIATTFFLDNPLKFYSTISLLFLFAILKYINMGRYYTLRGFLIRKIRVDSMGFLFFTILSLIMFLIPSAQLLLTFFALFSFFVANIYFIILTPLYKL
ncbi:MAG: glycosyltransferase [Candidatus Omnitrophica bacterium]|nr:glycosyltransferase [Candidatus Omnitrophota bacterium]